MCFSEVGIICIHLLFYNAGFSKASKIYCSGSASDSEGSKGTEMSFSKVIESKVDCNHFME